MMNYHDHDCGDNNDSIIIIMQRLTCHMSVIEDEMQATINSYE